MRPFLHVVSRPALVASLGFASTFSGVAQTPVPADRGCSYLLVDGKETGLQRAIQQRLTYPLQVARDHIEGWVYVSFRTDTDGSVKDVRINQKLNDFCDGAALEAVRKLPLLEPARKWGQPIATYCTVPIKFSWRTPQPRAK